MINILLAEDQSMVCGALASLINLEDDLNVVFQVDDGLQAWDIIQDNHPDIDILLTDIEMPNMSGIELAEKTRQQFPEVKIVIVTTFSKPGYILRALQMDVSAFLLKNTPSSELAKALRDAAKGKKIIDTKLAMSALRDDDPLTGKERQALKLAAEGKTTQQIGEHLFLSEGTVRNYLSEAISKLDASNRVDAARIAQQKGWL